MSDLMTGVETKFKIAGIENRAGPDIEEARSARAPMSACGTLHWARSKGR